MNSILKDRKIRIESQTKNSSSEKTRVYAQKPRLKMPFKNSIFSLFFKRVKALLQKVIMVIGNRFSCLSDMSPNHVKCQLCA
jgi:hypothetical protein